MQKERVCEEVTKYITKDARAGSYIVSRDLGNLKAWFWSHGDVYDPRQN